MEGTPNQTPENSLKNKSNFHEISEKRKELRRAIGELGDTQKPTPETRLIGKQLKGSLAGFNELAKEFKIKDFGSLGEAKKFLEEQRDNGNEELKPIDFESIYNQFPEFEKIESVFAFVNHLKAQEFKNKQEKLTSKTSGKKAGAGMQLDITQRMLDETENEFGQFGLLEQHMAELVRYRQNLSETGHICLTPSTQEYINEIGKKLLSGRPIFLHGPTGTGKTSIAEFSAKMFTGKEPEMVYCNPQTRKSDYWGRVGVRPAEGEAGKHGAIETFEVLGALARAIAEGKTVIFDEFTALPKELMVSIKGVLKKKPGDMVPIDGNGIVEMKPGFQIIFTANLKSKKNTERNDLPPEMADEFSQNNLEIKYTPQDEAYDIMLSRLLNRDGSLDMSFYDLNITLPNLCKVMTEIQESYAKETNKEVARRVGALDAGNKVHSLEKFVMTQRSIASILEYWEIEQETSRKKEKVTFSEFIDQRLKFALTYKEFPESDRILVAKILASRGFLLTLTAKDLDLPEDIFKLNTIKAMRGEEAVEELRKESGAVKHLTLKEVAELDPFHKRAELLKGRAEALLGGEGTTKDSFLSGLSKRMEKIYGKEKKNLTTEISVSYNHPDGKKETITLDLEAKLQEFISFYQKTNIDLPPDFEDTFIDIWDKNQSDIEKAIEQNGFNEMLIIPGNIPLTDLKDKMTMESGYWESDNFKAGGSFTGAVSQNVDKPRIILVHKTQELTERPELASTLNIKGQDVKLGQTLTLEDYIIFQRKYFEETGKHLDEKKYVWLATKSGARLVDSIWYPDHRKLYVNADDLGDQNGYLGVRPSRCFF